MRRRLLAAFFLAWLAVPPAPAQTTNAPPAASAAPAPVNVPPAPNAYPKAIPAVQVIAAANAALVTYPMPDATEPDRAVTDVRQAMQDRQGEIRVFAETTASLLAQNPSLDTIRALESHGDYLATFPASWTSTLADLATHLGKKIDQLDNDETTWRQTQSALQASAPAAPPDLTRQAGNVLARLALVRKDLTSRQGDLFKLENDVNDEANRVNKALNHLQAARHRAVSQLFERNAPPVWSPTALPASSETEQAGWAQQGQALAVFAAAEPGKFALHGALLFLLVSVFYRLRRFARALTAQEPGIAPAAQLFERPVAAGLLLSLFASAFLYYPVAPRLLFALIGAVALVPSVILVRRLIEPRLYPVLHALVVFFFLEEFRSVASFPPAPERLFLLTEILGAVLFLAWLILSLRRAPNLRIGRPLRVAGWSAFAILVAGWLAEVLGYTLLAGLLCAGVQRSATLGLALYAAIRVVEALLFIFLRLRPFARLGMMRQHRDRILRRAQRVVAGAAALGWAYLTLSLVPSNLTLAERIFGSSLVRSGGWFGRYSSRGVYELNLVGKLAVAALIVGAAVQLSRFARFVLEEEFYPRLRLSAGLPYAISTSLHYLVLVAAFLGATVALGIDLTKFTILVSALGVGVGFGLQNIINNFVSGLILLFERPVKLGDTILTGTDTGTVERIGIRASVLRTASGTEVIVPNGTLISNNVTNWTLSGRERIILIPLAVPRGPDVARLVGLLTGAAAAHPFILKQPPPQVLAQTLGANLGLELRAWTGPDSDWTQVRSEVILALHTVLAGENIPLA